MKLLIIIILGVYGWMGFETHKGHKVSVQQSVVELFEQNSASVDVTNMNLPLSFTFLSSKVESEVFFDKGRRSGSVLVNVTPIESYPIISVFNPMKYQITISNKELIKLLM